MSSIVLVPIYIDALHLRYGKTVAEAMVNFSQLPYFNNFRDVNPDTANVSELILSQPFQNQNLQLKPGIHLHWSLPDALTKEIQNGIFPAVPNRWLVTRREDKVETGSWVIESDYLYPLSAGYQSDSVIFPWNVNDNTPRFRFLGRKMPLNQWISAASSSVEPEYLNRLTAVGYGEPTFAAFYPNCRSVFGFHDPKYAGDILPSSNLSYDVIGWYSQANQNYLDEFIKAFTRNYQISYTKVPTVDQIIAAVEEHFQWNLKWTEAEVNPTVEVPQIVCYARLNFNPPTGYQGQPPSPTLNVSVAVANTGTEALSAYLAQQIDQSRKAIIEEQLEALQLAESIENQQLDVGEKLRQLRHEGGFNALSAGWIWTVRLTTQEQTDDQTQLKLPSEFASLLDRLNQVQQEYDGAIAEIESRQRQLFADWYKYMISVYPPEDSLESYPDIDAVKYFIQTQGIAPLQRLLTTTGTIDLKLDEKGQLRRGADNLVIRPTAPNGTLAQRLANEINNLLNAIGSNPIYHLERLPSPRYWQPKEPVVMLVGEGVKATQRHGQDNQNGLLACEIINNVNLQEITSAAIFQVIFNRINQLEQSGSGDRIGFRVWTEQPWNPFLLEWLVEVFPLANGSNLAASNRKYSRTFLTDNYILSEQDVDLSPKAAYRVIPDTIPNFLKTDQDSNIYSGSSILTPQAGLLLQKRVDAYLAKYTGSDPIPPTMVNPVYEDISKYLTQLTAGQPNPIIESSLRQRIPDTYRANPNNPEEFLDLSTVENLQKLKQWYESNQLNVIPNPVFTAKRAQELLKNFNCLSQCLGGFNQALLMQKQTLQLEINDPIGFDTYQSFTNEVRQLVGDTTDSAPQPLNIFSPLRSGELNLIDLQLIDTFGQIRNLDWQWQTVIVPETMKAQVSDRVALPPRFVQPTRVNLRWLSANNSSTNNGNDQQMNAATSPICGWILPNYLDGSLMFYSQEGQALGVINTDGEWNYAPGEAQITVENIPNLHLRKLVTTICSLGRHFLDNFLLTVNDALENIAPESFAQNPSLALLIGRPIAVVRIAVNLELLGLPALNQDWQVFRQEMQQRRGMEDRETADFTHVQFPIRIGEYQQLNDGVIGYWKEVSNPNSPGGYEYEGNIFYAQQSDINESSHIETQYWDANTNPGIPESPINIIQSIASPPQNLTMLIDPRGLVHATSGILPVKTIDIPAEQYVDALAAIAVTFLTAPILCDRRQISLPLPTEPEYDWSWLENKQTQWTQTYATPTIKRDIFLQHYPMNNPQEVWQALISQGWLTNLNNDPNQVKIIAKDQRPPLTGILAELETTINETFDLYQEIIDPVETKATFSRSQALREGWLVLTKKPSNGSDTGLTQLSQ